MTRFAVYQNRNLRSSASFPLLVDVQSEVLQDLETRVVIPLARAASFTDFPLRYVMPSVEVEGKKYLLMTPQLTGLSRVLLGPLRGASTLMPVISPGRRTFCSGVSQIPEKAAKRAAPDSPDRTVIQAARLRACARRGSRSRARYSALRIPCGHSR